MLSSRVEPAFNVLDAGAGAALPSLRHLDGVSLFVAGFSESRQVLSWLHQALGCPQPGLVKEDACMLASMREDPSSLLPPNYRKLARCREALFSRTPFQSACPRGVNLHFEWKSFQWSAARDLAFRDRVAAAARSGQKVVVVLAGGPHHFSRFADHEQQLQFQVADNFPWPQHWIDEYVESTGTLFDAFGARSGLPSNVCVLWRLSNVAPRHEAGLRADSLHHPSARNGLHDWLNRFTAGLARRAGIRILDTTDVTLGHPPALKLTSVRRVGSKHSRALSELVNHSSSRHKQTNVTTTRRLHNPHSSADHEHHGSSHAKRKHTSLVTQEIEGDVYHGFTSSVLLEPFCSRMCAACGL